jgi:hypothetical protein
VAAAATAYVESHKDCGNAADCVQVVGACYAATEGCCVVYMNTSYVPAEWTAIHDQLEACSGGPCACCAAIPPDPACNSGRCGPE